MINNFIMNLLSPLEANEKWQYYLKLIHDAEASFVEQTEKMPEKASCLIYTNLVDEDLAVFKSGILKHMIDDAIPR